MRPGVIIRTGFLCAGLLVVACGDGREPAPFQATRVQPSLGGTDGEPELVHLNQEITIRFNRRVDPLSVTETTVRVVDEAGQRVKGVLRRQGHLVTFEPVAPVAPTLDDGSFRPGRQYQLEVAGFPRAAAVRSVEGEVLERSIVNRFRAVAATHQPSPLLHASTSPFGFALEESMLRMAEDSRTLTLYFHEPPMPTTATPAAFKLYRPRVGEPLEFEVFSPKSVELLRLPPSHPNFPPWLVELDLGRPPGGYLCVELVADPELALRDYRGTLPRRVMSQGGAAARIGDAVGEKLLVEVFPGLRVPLIQQEFNGQVEFEPETGAVGFEVRNGRATPQVRVESGTGSLGTFMPQADTELVAGRAFDRGDGRQVTSPGPTFDFVDIHIPKGVTVRLSSGGTPVQLRACGDIRIDGELVLEDTPLGVTLESREDIAASDIASSAGAALVAGGDITVQGRIVHLPSRERAPRTGSPLALLAGGDLWLPGGRLPARITLAREPGDRVHGEARSGAIPVATAPMTPDLPPGISLRAAAATEWFRLPITHYRRVEIELRDVEGDLRVQVQSAPPDAADPSRPSRDGLLAPVPLPMKEPLNVPPGGFVRFHLEARVHAGESAPSIGGLTVVGV